MMCGAVVEVYDVYVEAVGRGKLQMQQIAANVHNGGADAANDSSSRKRKTEAELEREKRKGEVMVALAFVDVGSGQPPERICGIQLPENVPKAVVLRKLRDADERGPRFRREARAAAEHARQEAERRRHEETQKLKARRKAERKRHREAQKKFEAQRKAERNKRRKMAPKELEARRRLTQTGERKLHKHIAGLGNRRCPACSKRLATSGGMEMHFFALFGRGDPQHVGYVQNKLPAGGIFLKDDAAAASRAAPRPGRYAPRPRGASEGGGGRGGGGRNMNVFKGVDENFRIREKAKLEDLRDGIIQDEQIIYSNTLTNHARRYVHGLAGQLGLVVQELRQWFDAQPHRAPTLGAGTQSRKST